METIASASERHNGPQSESRRDEGGPRGTAPLEHELATAFARDGFAIVPDALSADDCRRLRERALDIVEAWEPTAERTVFTTDQQERQSNAEFLASGSTTWCFFEEEAFGPDGELVRDKQLSINKIGHAQHDLDDEFERISNLPVIAEAADAAGLIDPLALQSMYIFKQPYIGGEVGCHHDATFLYTDPVTVTGFWFALEDATVDNGCLWAEPGGHRSPLRQQFRRRTATQPAAAAVEPGAAAVEPGAAAVEPGAAAVEPGAAAVEMEFIDCDATPWPSVPPAADSPLRPLEVPAGTMVVLHGLLPHWSSVNRSGTSRHAYTLHCISAAADYPAWNWLQRTPSLPLRRLGEPASGRSSAR